MNYDHAFFQMLEQRGRELYPLSLPYVWYSIDSATGIVLMDKEKTAYPWYLSWIREENDELIAAVHPRREPINETVATHKHLEKMSGDDIVHLLATHFLFLEDLQQPT
jgi:hypothetical protein